MLEKIYYKVNKLLRSDTIVIIYQMGKVGSSSIYNSVNRYFKTYHIHYLNEKIISQIYQKSKDKNQSVPLHLETSTEVLNLLKSEKKIKIISLIREPISRNLSAFFENLDNFTFNQDYNLYKLGINKQLKGIIENRQLLIIVLDNLGKEFKTKGSLISLIEKALKTELNNKDKLNLLKYSFQPSPEEILKLKELFINQYPHNLPIDWFDIELNKSLKIDIFDYPFNKESGFVKIQINPQTELLIIKSEIANFIKKNYLKDFLNIKKINIFNKNESESKYYYEVYNFIKQNLSFSEVYLEKQLKSKYMKHFYTKTEIKNLRNKWINKTLKK